MKVKTLSLLLTLAVFAFELFSGPTSWAGVPSASLSLGGELSGSLKKHVDFWIDIYSKYHTSQSVIHDARYVDHIYEVIDSPGSAKEAKKKWRAVLMSLHEKQVRAGKPDLDPATLTANERKVYALFDDIREPSKFLNAAHRKRLRSQIGQREAHLDGLKASGRYLPLMEEVFKANGLPIELTRLPFVESSFNLKARSKVGASGIWQFMPNTGRLFLNVNAAIDERNDPVRATEAAARLLKLNYDSLGTWPLAVTAYNNGRKNMMRLVRRLGSQDFEDLLTIYHGRAFGFASSNFYSCLLATIEIHKNYRKYFGEIEFQKPDDFFEAPLPDSVVLPELIRLMSYDTDRLKVLNPGIESDVFRGKLMLPAAYKLRLPMTGSLAGLEKASAAKVFLIGYAQIPAVFKSAGTDNGTSPYPSKPRSGTRRRKQHNRRSE